MASRLCPIVRPYNRTVDEAVVGQFAEQRDSTEANAVEAQNCGCGLWKLQALLRCLMHKSHTLLVTRGHVLIIRVAKGAGGGRA